MKTIQHHTCLECGTSFISSVWNKKYCSRTCFLKHHRDKIRANQRRWEARHHPRKAAEKKVCANCQKTFESRIPWQAFCSEKCRDADHYRRHKPRYTAYTKGYRKDHPEKARQACRRYYAKHSNIENAKSRERYAEKKKKLAEAERILAEHGQPKKIGRTAQPRSERQYFKVGEMVEQKLASGKELTAARSAVAKAMNVTYSSVVRYHKQFRLQPTP